MSLGRTPVGPPAGTVLPGLPLGIEAETGDDQKHVTIANADRDPLSGAPPSITEKAFRGHLILHEPSVAKDEGRRPGAVVAVVVQPGMPSSPLVGETLNMVGGGNGAFDRKGSIARCNRPSIDENGVVGMRLVGHCVLGPAITGARRQTDRQNEREKREGGSH